MKKLLAIIFILAVLLTAVACNGNGGDTTDDTTVGDATDTTTADPSVNDEPNDTTTDGAKDDPVDPTDDFLKVDIDTVIYTADDDGVHLEGQHSGLYAKPDRETALDGGIADGTAVKVTAVLYEDETDPTIGWAYIIYGEDGKTAYIRISQVKCFVAPDPIDLTELISSDKLMSEYSDIEMAAIRKSVADMGYTVTVNDDGTATMEGEESVLIQFADGSWKETDADGAVYYYYNE